MRPITLIGLLFFVILTSCTEYSSDFPISQIEESYAKDDIYGTWDYVWNTDNDDPHRLLIYKYSEKEYLLLFIPQEKETSDEIIAFKSYITRIGDHEFANSRVITDGSSDDDSEFLIHKFEVENDKLTFSSIPSKLIESLGIEFNSVKDHYKFIEENVENLPYWSVRYEYKRIGSGGDVMNNK